MTLKEDYQGMRNRCIEKIKIARSPMEETFLTETKLVLDRMLINIEKAELEPPIDGN